MEASGSPPAADSNPDVFIVDSDPRSAEELRLITEACGYRVEVFTDGQPALERLRGHQPRLLIMELLLPVLDGFELCQAIRADLGYQQLPVLCVSGISWGSVDLADLLHKRFKARFLAKGLLVDRYLAILQDMLHEPATQSVQAVETVLKDRQEASAEAKPIEVSRLEMQAEPVVRAVMSSKALLGCIYFYQAIA